MWNSAAPKIFVYRKTEEAGAGAGDAGSVFSSGTVALSGAAGLAVDVPATALCLKVPNKKREKNRKSLNVHIHYHGSVSLRDDGGDPRAALHARVRRSADADARRREPHTQYRKRPPLHRCFIAPGQRRSFYTNPFRILFLRSVSHLERHHATGQSPLTTFTRQSDFCPCQSRKTLVDPSPTGNIIPPTIRITDLS